MDGVIKIYQSGITHKLLHTIESHAMPIRSLAFSPDSQLWGSQHIYQHSNLTNKHSSTQLIYYHN